RVAAPPMARPRRTRVTRPPAWPRWRGGGSDRVFPASLFSTISQQSIRRWSNSRRLDDRRVSAANRSRSRAASGCLPSPIRVAALHLGASILLPGNKMGRRRPNRLGKGCLARSPFRGAPAKTRASKISDLSHCWTRASLGQGSCVRCALEPYPYTVQERASMTTTSVRHNPVSWVIWILVAGAGALGFATIAGVRGEGAQVNAVWMIVAGLCTYAVAYRFYSRWIATRVFG